MAFCDGGSSDVSAAASKNNTMYNTLKPHTKDVHTVCGGPTLKDVERFRKKTVRELYERCPYEGRTFMSEVMENHATSKLSNVHPNNHELVNIMARRFRRDREPRRIPIRSLKRPKNKSRKDR